MKFLIRFRSFVRSGIVFLFLLVLWQGCVQSEYCAESDFYTIDKIDAHCHIDVKTPYFLEQAKKDYFRVLTINTDAPLDENIYEQQEIALYQQKKFPGQISYLTTFSMEGWGSDGWLEKNMAYINQSLHNGALGVKVWKNIGMVEKDRDGSFIMVDDPRFDPLFSYLEQHNIPVCGHLGEPRNCWLPIEEMTVNNDKSYYKEHRRYHMFRHPEYPSYRKQVKARDHMLEKHPALRFMGAHLASLEWNVDMLAAFLDRFPNATADMAARICHLQLQAQKDCDKVRHFMIKYQDRIIYGTDMVIVAEPETDPQKLIKETHETWLNDWKFLTTDQTMTVEEVDGEFIGLKLPREVIEKVYRINAEKMFPGI